jgi:hypothetical protein
VRGQVSETPEPRGAEPVVPIEMRDPPLRSMETSPAAVSRERQRFERRDFVVTLVFETKTGVSDQGSIGNRIIVDTEPEMIASSLDMERAEATMLVGADNSPHLPAASRRAPPSPARGEGKNGAAFSSLGRPLLKLPSSPSIPLIPVYFAADTREAGDEGDEWRWRGSSVPRARQSALHCLRCAPSPRAGRGASGG